MNCQNGDALAWERVTTASEKKVLDLLGDAASHQNRLCLRVSSMRLARWYSMRSPNE